MAKDLIDLYTPEKYTPEELQALQEWTTGDTALQVNSILANLDTGIPVNKVKGDKTVKAMVGLLDTAMERVKTPDDLMAYIPLMADIKKPLVQFKGYQSVTLDPAMATTEAVIQMIIPKGSFGVYLDDFSTTPGQAEFLLPRATGMRIINGPKKIPETGQYAYNAIMM